MMGNTVMMKKKGKRKKEQQRDSEMVTEKQRKEVTKKVNSCTNVPLACTNRTLGKRRAIRKCLEREREREREGYSRR